MDAAPNAPLVLSGALGNCLRGFRNGQIGIVTSCTTTKLNYNFYSVTKVYYIGGGGLLSVIFESSLDCFKFTTVAQCQFFP